MTSGIAYLSVGVTEALFLLTNDILKNLQSVSITNFVIGTEIQKHLLTLLSGKGSRGNIASIKMPQTIANFASLGTKPSATEQFL